MPVTQRKEYNMAVTAKGIVKNKFWVLIENKRLIGEISANQAGRGYSITFHGGRQNVDSVNDLKIGRKKIKFVDPPKREFVERDQVHGYPTDSEPFNGVWDLNYKAPIYTKEDNSKSWYCAGWFLIKKGRNWKQEFCPKLITIERYEHRGPYQSQTDLLKVKA